MTDEKQPIRQISGNLKEFQSAHRRIEVRHRQGSEVRGGSGGHKRKL